MTMNRILAKIKLAKKIAIFAHKNPDPDAYGAMFAMREFCRNLNIEAEIFAIKNRKGYLDNIFPLEEVRTDFKSEDFDLVIILDLHLIGRLASEFVFEVEKCKNIIVIDHHKIVEGDVLPTKNYLIMDDYAATCEILTDFAVECDLKITPTIATYLYTGLMGDTDRFLHNNLTRHVFETAILLYDKKAEIQHVYDFLYRYKTQQQLEIYKYMLDNLTYYEGKKAVCSIFTLKDLQRLGADQEDVKVYTNDLVKIKGVELSILGIEYKKNYFKFSLRSNGLNTVNFATRMGGGGHVCASAFETEISLKELKKLMPKWIKGIVNGK